MLEAKLNVKPDYYNALCITDLLGKTHKAFLEKHYVEGLEALHRLLDWLSPSQIKKLEPVIIKLERMLEGLDPINPEACRFILEKISYEVHVRGWLRV